MNPVVEYSANMTRRQLLGSIGAGIGSLALGSLVMQDATAVSPDATASYSHIAPKAKRVIYLFQNGGPSQVDLFENKPVLHKLAGQDVPAELIAGKRFSTMTQGDEKTFLPSINKFRKQGECGRTIAEDYLPHTARVVDQLCFISSMQTTQVNHVSAITNFLTGSETAGSPSMGAWLTYGLGSETEDLPGFVVMTSRDRNALCEQISHDFYWGNGYLPSRHQGVKFRANGDPLLYLSNPHGLSREMRRTQLNDLARLNYMALQKMGDPEIATRIAQYEMAYRMQASVPELTDLSDETKSTLDMYGPQVHRRGSYAHNCLMARRLAERGCRFIQLMHAGWDQHSNLLTQLKIQCEDTDEPSAALVKDLAQRGLLEDTLVIWGGEFGRTPYQQIEFGDEIGRDHHPYAFTLWMAGGGVKPGITYGQSDEFGFTVTEKPVRPNDLHATILHLLGIDHERFTYRYQGLDQRLTGVEESHVIHDIVSGTLPR